jgi:hypothetical protein
MRLTSSANIKKCGGVSRRAQRKDFDQVSIGLGSAKTARVNEDKPASGARQDDLIKSVERAKSINTQETRLTPIDESAQIPEAMRRAAAFTDSYFQPSKSQRQLEN